MQFTQINRAELATIFGDIEYSSASNLLLNQGEPGNAPDPRTVFVCWNEDSQHERRLPQLVIVSDEELEDFLAWSVTFLSVLRPLTAFARVLSWSDYALSQAFKRKSEFTQTSVVVGAIPPACTPKSIFDVVPALPLTPSTIK